MNPDTAEIASPRFAFDNSYARELDGFYTPWSPAPSPQPRLIKLNRALAAELGLDAEALAGPAGVAVLAGNAVPAGAQPLAQVYAGHQFGGYSPRLGDGRALLLGEVIDVQGRRRDIAFKGSGRTPFSRGGDGKAALGPVLREYLVGEAMHALGIPTTRALAVVATGEPVWRERALPGAILTRVASSHVRVGTVQYFSAQREDAQVRRLADYVIARHYPELRTHQAPYLELLRGVAERQAQLIARWMGVGFIHGVMNTDNMTLSGETIDYGPCAFMEAYDPGTVFSSIDEHGRYAYGNQPTVAQWNLARLAEALLPLLHTSMDEAVALAMTVIEAFPGRYRAHWLAVMRAKLGLAVPASTAQEGDPQDGTAQDGELAEDFLALLQRYQVDFTLGFRALNSAAAGSDQSLLMLMATGTTQCAEWIARWRARLQQSTMSETARAAIMARANPIYIARNHQVEEALAAAVERDDRAPFERLLGVLAAPFDERSADAAFAAPAPREVTACYRTFCGT